MPLTTDWPAIVGALDVSTALSNLVMFIKVLIGFSIIIFVHELGHFLAAKWVGVRVDRFAVGFGYRLFGWRHGEGLTFGSRPSLPAAELAARGWGETDYCFKALPIGGYVKMLGQDDIVIDEKTDEIRISDDPRAFTNRSVGQRMIVISAGVVFNLLFAAALLTLIFLVGKPMPAPVIGAILPESPAQGKLHLGDRIVAIDGSPIRSFVDVNIATIMTEGPIRVRVERAATRQTDEVVVDPRPDPETGLRTLEIGAAFSLEVTEDGTRVGDLPNVKKGDVIVAVDGKRVSTALEVVSAFSASHGRTLSVLVERRDPQRPADLPRPIECFQRAAVEFSIATLPDERIGPEQGDAHMLGLLPRRRIDWIEPGGPAAEAGFEVGDVIVEWGAIANPLYNEITELIQARAGEPITAVVQRGDRRLTLPVTPRRPLSLWGAAPAKVKARFLAEQDMPVVAAVAPETPAAALNMPRGSLLLSVDGKPVSTWPDVCEALFAAAGRTIAVRYRAGPDEVDAELRVPSSVVNELDLPPNAMIVAIDGETSAPYVEPGGKLVEVRLPNDWAVRRLLQRRIGRTVKVQYRLDPLTSPKALEAPFEVREDNFDPWPMRVHYVYDSLKFRTLMETVHAHGNPAVALWMGVQECGTWALQAYKFLRLMFVSRAATQNVAGPVGIIGAAIERARLGWLELAYFLAFLSVNLAVINFLPMPVMDGGLMVFLLIEKLKGKPLSLKTQMVTTLVGLAAIILIGVLVTIQDIGRFFSS
jgi:regulator of sigma E protease